MSSPVSYHQILSVAEQRTRRRGRPCTGLPALSFGGLQGKTDEETATMLSPVM